VATVLPQWWFEAMDQSGRRQSHIFNGARSLSDSQGIGSNNDGINPILRAETLATMKAGQIARAMLSDAISGGDTAVATAASTLK